MVAGFLLLCLPLVGPIVLCLVPHALENGLASKLQCRYIRIPKTTCVVMTFCFEVAGFFLSQFWSKGSAFLCYIYFAGVFFPPLMG